MVLIYPSLLHHQIDGVGLVYSVAMVTKQKAILLGFSLFIGYCLIDRRSYGTSLISNKTFFFFCLFGYV